MLRFWISPWLLGGIALEGATMALFLRAAEGLGAEIVVRMRVLQPGSSSKYCSVGIFWNNAGKLKF